MIFCQQTAEKKTDVNIFHIFSCELLFDSILKIKMNPYTMKETSILVSMLSYKLIWLFVSHISMMQLQSSGQYPTAEKNGNSMAEENEWVPFSGLIFMCV